MIDTVERISSPAERSEACQHIISVLPAWFGIEEANRKYIKDAAAFPAIGVRENGNIIALLIYRPLGDILDIHWMGVLPAFHRRGLGAQLIDKLEEIALSHGIRRLTVETLDPALGDVEYSGTFLFYESCGFSIFRYFSYDERNRMVRMAKDLSA